MSVNLNQSVQTMAQALDPASRGAPSFARIWTPGVFKPRSRGDYERLSKLGVIVDHFDGAVWRRLNHKIERTPGALGIRCANQDLPWRMSP